MTGTAADAWISLLIQFPLVGIFVWFTLKINERNQSAMERRDSEWREFLKDQRQQNNEALGRIAEEVKSATRMVAVNQSLIVEHDKNFQEILPAIKNALEALKRDR